MHVYFNSIHKISKNLHNVLKGFQKASKRPHLQNTTWRWQLTQKMGGGVGTVFGKFLIPGKAVPGFQVKNTKLHNFAWWKTAGKSCVTESSKGGPQPSKTKKIENFGSVSSVLSIVGRKGPGHKKAEVRVGPPK